MEKIYECVPEIMEYAAFFTCCCIPLLVVSIVHIVHMKQNTWHKTSIPFINLTYRIFKAMFERSFKDVFRMILDEGISLGITNIKCESQTWWELFPHYAIIYVSGILYCGYAVALFLQSNTFYLLASCLQQ